MNIISTRYENLLLLLFAIAHPFEDRGFLGGILWTSVFVGCWLVFRSITGTLSSLFMERLHMFKGIYTSMITPYKDGKVVLPALGRLVERQLRAGIHGLVLFGPTGEGELLSDKEKTMIMELTNKKMRERAQMIVDCTSISTERAIENVKVAHACGAAAVLIAPPAYVLPSQDGILAHYIQIASASDIPVIVHRIPKHTGCDVDFSTMVRLAEHEKIIAVAGQQMGVEQIQRLKAAVQKKMSFICANDTSALVMMLSGVKAVISQSANLLPRRWGQIWEHRLHGEIPKAQGIHEALVGLHESFSLESGPGPIKASLSLLGLCSPEIRLPMMWPLRPSVYRIAAEMEQLGLQIQTGELS